MPRRKQDRPQRMQWELNDQAKNPESSKAEDYTDSSPGEEEEEDDENSSSNNNNNQTNPTPPQEPVTTPEPPATTSGWTPGNSPREASSPTCSFQKDGGDEAPEDVEEDLNGSTAELYAPVSPENFSGDSRESQANEMAAAVSGDDGPLDFSLKVLPTSKHCPSPTPTPPPAPPLSADGPLDLSVPQRKVFANEVPKKAKVARLEASYPTSPWGYVSPRGMLMNTVKGGLPKNGTIKLEPMDRHCISPIKIAKELRPFQHTSSNATLDMMAVNSLCSSEQRRLHRMNSSDQATNSTSHDWRRRNADDKHEKHSSKVKRHKTMSSSSSSLTSTPCTSVQSAAPLSYCGDLLRDSVPLPRKLVRGQDVWLGRGAEQTRQILKCMWCGQSFKSLADMTTHMKVTQHYTNIISQEQITSWRMPEDKLGTQSHVNAVLTCKVCNKAFSSLKELSYHIVKYSHYKDYSTKLTPSTGESKRHSSREKRKKALSVRKLLEIERMETKDTIAPPSHSRQDKTPPPVDGKVTCEECGEKVDAKDFVLHIKDCSHGSRVDSSGGMASVISSAPKQEPPNETSSSLEHTEIKREMVSPGPNHTLSRRKNSGHNGSHSTRPPSVLNAIEKLIEKNFNFRGRKTSTGILQRLGIEEEVCLPWHRSYFTEPPGLRNAAKPLHRFTNSRGSTSIDGRSPDEAGGTFSGSNSPSPVSTPSTVICSSPGIATSLTPDTSAPTLSPATANSPPSPMSRTSNKNLVEPERKDIPSRPPSAKDMPNIVDMDAVKYEPVSPAASDGEATDCDQDFSSPPGSPMDKKMDMNLFDNATGTRSSCSTPQAEGRSDHRKSVTPPSGGHSQGHSSDPVNGNPLRELQKLLDKTEAHMSRATLPTVPQSLLSFPWIPEGSGSPLKCAFCDNHFTCPRAYRNHLSEVHFLEQGDSSTSAKKCKENSSSEESSCKPNPESSQQDESPHSKFLKYSELAKQLSSKYV